MSAATPTRSTKLNHTEVPSGPISAGHPCPAGDPLTHTPLHHKHRR